MQFSASFIGVPGKSQMMEQRQTEQGELTRGLGPISKAHVQWASVNENVQYNTHIANDKGLLVSDYTSTETKT